MSLSTKLFKVSIAINKFYKSIPPSKVYGTAWKIKLWSHIICTLMCLIMLKWKKILIIRLLDDKFQKHLLRCIYIKLSSFYELWETCI